MSRLFETLFGPLSLSDVFNYREKVSTVGNPEPEVSDDKYIFKFHLGSNVDLDCLRVSVKDNLLKVSYEKDGDNGYTKYSFARTLPEDANLETVKAEAEDKILTITVNRILPPEEQKTREIPVNFEN